MLQHDRPVSVVKSNARRSDEALKIIAPQSDQRCTNYHELDNIYPKGSSKSHHHLKINEGPVSRGRTQPTHENASSRPDNPERASPRPPTPTKSPRDFSVAHHQNTIHPGERRLVLKDWDKEGFHGGTRYELRQRVGGRDRRS